MDRKFPTHQTQRNNVATTNRVVLFDGRSTRTSTSLLLPLLTALLAITLGGCGKGPEGAKGAGGPAALKLTARGNTVTVVSVGDILLGNAAAPDLASKGFDWPFEHVRPLLGDADLVIGNLAAPITSATKKLSRGDEYTYKLDAESALALKRAGFHALCLGNDHVLDYGVAGLRDTLAALGKNNLIGFGAGDNETRAREGAVCDFGTLRIGLLAYGDDGKEARALAKGERGGYALLSAKNLKADIARMRQQADLVVVSLHWGKNYKEVTEAQQRMGHQAIELGADIVYGHHPHVIQGIEIYQGKPIVYSLGNFAFGTRGRYKENQGYGLVSRWVFEDKKLKWLLATPIAVNNEVVKFQPRMVPAEEARRALQPHLNQYQTNARWQGSTAFVGFDPEWQTAALPSLPWKELDTSGSASSATALPVAVRE